MRHLESAGADHGTESTPTLMLVDGIETGQKPLEAKMAELINAYRRTLYYKGNHGAEIQRAGDHIGDW